MVLIFRFYNNLFRDIIVVVNKLLGLIKNLFLGINILKLWSGYISINLKRFFLVIVSWDKINFF